MTISATLQTPTLTGINSDALGCILSLLDPYSLARVSRACKRLLSAADSVSKKAYDPHKLAEYSEAQKRLISLERLAKIKEPRSIELAQSRIPDDLIACLLTPSFKKIALARVQFVKNADKVISALKIDLHLSKVPAEMAIRCSIEQIPGPCYVQLDTKTYRAYITKNAVGKIETFKVFRDGLPLEGKCLPPLSEFRMIPLNP